MASEALLRNGDEEMKNQTLSKLKDIKALWEETLTYIIHCHRYRLCPYLKRFITILKAFAYSDICVITVALYYYNH